MSSNITAVDDELEWEEWDGTSPFWTHCVAGSIAGVAEHTLVYPFDTVKTHLQACADCPHTATTTTPTTASSSMATNATHHKLSPSPRTGMWTTMRHIVSQASVATASTQPAQAAEVAGMGRLWRGVYTIVIGCIPAHALYFSTYEAVKFYAAGENGQLSATGGMAAGAAAAVSHDLIMTPLDTIKQRLQLGHYTGMRHALTQMVQHEGATALLRSFPITLLTNIPYGMVMVSTNEVLKQYMQQDNAKLSVSTCILASSVAGATAAAVTTPLDRIKTYLQTQQLQPACRQGSCPKVGPPIALGEALSTILQKEGPQGLFRGLAPRVISHTPAVAISWTTYETAKQWLASHYL